MSRTTPTAPRRVSPYYFVGEFWRPTQVRICTQRPEGLPYETRLEVVGDRQGMNGVYIRIRLRASRNSLLKISTTGILKRIHGRSQLLREFISYNSNDRITELTEAKPSRLLRPRRRR